MFRAVSLCWQRWPAWWVGICGWLALVAGCHRLEPVDEKPAEPPFVERHDATETAGREDRSAAEEATLVAVALQVEKTSPSPAEKSVDELLKEARQAFAAYDEVAFGFYDASSQYFVVCVDRAACESLQRIFELHRSDFDPRFLERSLPLGTFGAGDFTMEVHVNLVAVKWRETLLAIFQSEHIRCFSTRIVNGDSTRVAVQAAFQCLGTARPLAFIAEESRPEMKDRVPTPTFELEGPVRSGIVPRRDREPTPAFPIDEREGAGIRSLPRL